MFDSKPLDEIPQLDAMRMGTSYRMNLTVRGFSLTVRPITIQETLQVAMTVAQKMNSLPVDARSRITEHVLIAQETLVLATTSEPGATDFKITHLMLDKMTPGEVEYLFKQYVAVTDKVNPALELLPANVIEALVEEVKKNKQQELALTLIELSFLELASLAHFLLTKGD